MNINYKQSQFELFSRNQEQAQQPKSKAISLKVPLTLENLVIFVILSIIVLLFSFSVGVERGKRLARKEIESGIVQKEIPSTAPKVASLEEQKPVMKAAKLDVPSLAVKEVPVEAADAAPSVDETSSSGGQEYTVQVASFKMNKYALEEAETLRGKGYKAFVLKRGNYSIVCVGKFGDKTDAQRFAVPLKERYGDYLIRRL